MTVTNCFLKFITAKWTNNWIGFKCCYYWWDTCGNWRIHASDGAAIGRCNCGFSSVFLDCITLKPDQHLKHFKVVN